MAARKPDIQYIDQFYVHGSEARVLELKPKKRRIKTVLPIARPEEKIEVRIDPVATCAIVVCVVMLILMAVGVHQYLQVLKLNQAMEHYVIELQNENVELREEYKAGYDPDDIRTKAAALGMIPLRNAQVVTINPVIPEPEPEPTLWDDVVWFFSGLFA